MIELLLTVLVLNALGLYAFILIARRRRLVDVPNQRSSHEVPTIRGGGLLLGPTFMVGVLMYADSHLLGALAILLGALVAWLDDLKNLSVKVRLPAYFIAVGLLLVDLGLTSPVWLFLLCLVLLTGWINTFNFMDGINGISSVYASVIMLSSLLVIPTQIHVLVYMLIVAIGVFAFFNFRKKAICFGGDIGSISLALISAWFVLIAWKAEGTGFYLLLFPALYAIDSVWTIIYRIRQGDNIFEAHRTHLYQILANEYAYDHRFIALGYGLLQGTINVSAYYILRSLPLSIQIVWVFLIYLSLSIVYIILKRRLRTRLT